MGCKHRCDVQEQTIQLSFIWKLKQFGVDIHIPVHFSNFIFEKLKLNKIPSKHSYSELSLLTTCAQRSLIA